MAGPVRLDARSRHSPAGSEIARGPEHAEHTEALLLELGYDWDQIMAFKAAGTVS